MIRHIVMFKLNADLTGANADVVATREALAALGPALPMVKGWEVRECFDVDRPVAHDFVLVSEFDSEEDLAAYAVDPDHQKVIARLDQIIAAKAVADFRV